MDNLYPGVAVEMLLSYHKMTIRVGKGRPESLLTSIPQSVLSVTSGLQIKAPVCWLPPKLFP